MIWNGSCYAGSNISYCGHWWDMPVPFNPDTGIGGNGENTYPTPPSLDAPPQYGNVGCDTPDARNLEGCKDDVTDDCDCESLANEWNAIKCYTNDLREVNDEVLYYNDPAYQPPITQDDGVYMGVTSPKYILYEDLADGEFTSHGKQFRIIYDHTLQPDPDSNINKTFYIYFSHVNRVMVNGVKTPIYYSITFFNESEGNVDFTLLRRGASIGWQANTQAFLNFFYNEDNATIRINSEERLHAFLSRAPSSWKQGQVVNPGGANLGSILTQAVPIPYDWPFDGAMEFSIANAKGSTTGNLRLSVKAFIDWDNVTNLLSGWGVKRDRQDFPGNQFGDTEETFVTGRSVYTSAYKVIGRPLNFYIDSNLRGIARLGITLFNKQKKYFSKWITNQSNYTKNAYYPNKGNTKNLVNCVYGADIIPVEWKEYDPPYTSHLKNTSNSDLNNIGVLYSHPFTIHNVIDFPIKIQYCVGMTRINPGGPCQSNDLNHPQHPCLQPIVFKWYYKVGTTQSAVHLVPLDCNMGGRDNTNSNSLYPDRYKNFSNWPERIVFTDNVNAKQTKQYFVEWALGEFSWGGIEHYIEVISDAPYPVDNNEPLDTQIPATYWMFRDEDGNKKEDPEHIYVYEPKHAAKYQAEHGCRNADEE